MHTRISTKWATLALVLTALCLLIGVAGFVYLLMAHAMGHQAVLPGDIPMQVALSWLSRVGASMLVVDATDWLTILGLSLYLLLAWGLKRC